MIFKWILSISKQLNNLIINEVISDHLLIHLWESGTYFLQSCIMQT